MTCEALFENSPSPLYARDPTHFNEDPQMSNLQGSYSASAPPRPIRSHSDRTVKYPKSFYWLQQNHYCKRDSQAALPSRKAKLTIIGGQRSSDFQLNARPKPQIFERTLLR
jgi:hypothetical protein